MTKQEFVNWAKLRGWVEDRFGHLQKQINGKEYRFKVSKIAVRYELGIQYENGGRDWIRLQGGYFKDLDISPEGKLTGLKR